jgi:thiol-disulfide isomerase/thioredoxin
MNRFTPAVVAAVLVLAAAWAQAVIRVGDEAKLKFQTVDGKPIDLEKLRGKIVVVDFWATWCGPCMAEAGHMVEINRKYAGPGFQFLGISLDQDKRAMAAVCKQKGFSWPQYFDGKVWENRVWRQWGSDGIPFTVLIDPDGKVAYAGHPAAGLDKALAETFRTHPPKPADDDKPTAKKDAPAGDADAKPAQDPVAAKAKAALSIGESYKKAGRMTLARAKYEAVIHDFPNTPYAQQAKEALTHLND